MKPIAVGNPNGTLMRIGKPTSISGSPVTIPQLIAVMMVSISGTGSVGLHPPLA